jgi:hypothetical protein
MSKCFLCGNECEHPNPASYHHTRHLSLTCYSCAQCGVFGVTAPVKAECHVNEILEMKDRVNKRLNNSKPLILYRYDWELEDEEFKKHKANYDLLKV